MIYKIITIFLITSTFLIAKGFEENTDSLTTLEFSFVGDIMCHSTQFNYSKVNSDSFDFKPVFREIKPYLNNSDIVVGNLETVIEVEGVKFSGYPVFNTPKQFLEGLKFAGFDFLSTANNHSFDIRERGVLSTLKYVSNYGMESIGTFTSQQKRDSIRIFEKNEIKYAILSYTYGVNLYKIPEETSYLVNLINKEIIKNDITNHRVAGADIIITFFHFGLEYAKTANSYQQEIVQFTIDSGADVIVGAHPHTLQPIEYFTSTSGNIENGFVAYSLGNFVSNQRWRYSDGAAVLNFEINKNHNSGKVSLAGVRYLPFWVFKGSTNNGLEYIVLPTEIAGNKKYLTKHDIVMMEESHSDTRKILTSLSDDLEMDSMLKSKKRQAIRDLQMNKFFISKIPFQEYEIIDLQIFNDSLQYIEIDSSLSENILSEIQ